MFTDTHCHLYHDRFDADREAVIDRAREAGVTKIVMPAIDVASIHAALDLAAKHEGLYVMAALHPSDTKEATDADWQEVERLAKDEHVVAVGESGLDHYWDRTFDEKQEDFFRRHIRLAVEVGKPLILHNREASEDLVRVLRDERAKFQDPLRLRGIFHCFGGPTWLTDAALELGFSLGLGGTLTYKNSSVGDAVAQVDLKHLVLETDAPFLAPVPHRGKRNEPAYVPLVAEKLAEVRGVSFEEIAAVTTENAARLFGI